MYANLFLNRPSSSRIGFGFPLQTKQRALCGNYLLNPFLSLGCRTGKYGRLGGIGVGILASRP